MASNSSSVVISFSVAILLLLILLLLLSYNSKSKRDNMENFYNTNDMSLPSLINPMGTFSEVMNKFSSNASRNEGFYNSVANNDGYAKNALSGDNGNMMGYEANQVVHILLHLLICLQVLIRMADIRIKGNLKRLLHDKTSFH